MAPLRTVPYPQREADSSTDRDTTSRQLLQRAQRASPAERDRIFRQVILLNIDFARSVVKRYRRRGVSDDDLTQIGCLGLVKACHGFDPAKGRSFLGYAVPTIRGEVRRFFRDNAWTVRPPRRIQELQAAIKEATAEMTQQLGQEPTAVQLAEKLDAPLADVVEATAADGCYTPASLDQPAGENDDLSVYEVFGEEDWDFHRAETVITLRPLCQHLPERDARILYLRFYAEWTQQRIADEFGITQMQVSRLLARILASLRNQLVADPHRAPAPTQRAHLPAHTPHPQAG